MKRISRIICIAMFILLLAVEVFAAKSGKCGDNITWEFSGNTLTLSGSGAMDDYESNNIPWFDYRLDIKEIIIDDRITAIGDYAFYHCSQFKDITFPSNLETVGRMAFFDCYALGNINLPSTVHTIGEDAFAGTRIDKVCLPKNLKNLSSGAFSRCSRLKAFELDPENEYFEVVDGVLYDWKKHRLYAYPAGKEDAVFTVPDDVYYITASAFQNCKNLQTLIFPDGIESIGNFAFYGSANLESIYIPDSLDRYGSLLFHTDSAATIYGVNGTKAEELAKEYNLAFSTEEVPVNTVDFTYKDGVLTVFGEGAIRTYAQGKAPWYKHHMDAKEIIVEEGITKIGFGAFQDFFDVEYIELPSSLKVLDEFFQRCDNVKEYFVSEDSKYFLTDNGILFSKDKKKIVRYPEGRKDVHYSIPDVVTEICDDAFNSAQFETVEIPDSVKKIGNNAFLNCSRLTAVRIPDGVNELKTYSFNSKNLSGIYIPPSVKKITNAFGSTKNLTIYGEKGSYAEEYAKEKNIEFSTKEMPDTFFSWFFEDGVLTIKCVGEMESYNTHNNPAPWMVHQNEIREVILVDGVTTVGKYAFDQCRLLKKVILPETVTKIDTGAFAFCDSLSEIVFPEDLATISSSAFYGCDSLSDIELPSKIEKIYEDAFLGCGIKELELPDSLEYIGSRAFAMCDNLQTVIIPKNVSKMGDFPFLMCNGLLSIEVHPSNKYYTSDNGILFNKDKTELLGYPPGNTAMIYIVPEYVKIIGNRAFYGDMYLKSVIFHDDIKEFGENVFAYNIFFTVHASKGSVTEKYALENNVQFLPIETDTTAVKPRRLSDVIYYLKNLKSAKQINTVLTQLRLLAE